MKDPASKSAIIGFFHEAKLYKSLEESYPKTIKEVVNPFVLSICVSPNNFFGKIHIEIMDQLISGGIPQYWHHWFFDCILKPIPQPPDEPQKLAYSNLEFGFVICGICCIIATSVFLLEVLCFYTPPYVGLIILLRFIRTKLV